MIKWKDKDETSKRSKSSTNTFLSTFIIILLNTAGIGLNWQWKKFRIFLSCLKYYLLVSFILTTFFQMILLKDCKTMHELSLTLAFIFSGIFLNISTLILHLEKQHIIAILDLVNNEIPAITSKHECIVSAAEKFKQFFFSQAVKFYVIYGFAVMSPFIFFPISGNKLGDTNTLLVPSLFPWKIDTGLKYILTIGLQFSWLAPLSIPVVLNFTFVVYFIIEVRVQFDILYGDVSKLKDQSSYYEYDDDRIVAEFKRCIRHYQMISKFVGNFCSCYKWLFTADLIYSLANLSLLLYGIVSGERTVSAFMQQMSAFVLVFSFLYLYCYIGQTLENANDRLEKCLYDVEWFKQTIKFRKLFFVFNSIIRQRVNLKAGSDFTASYELFAVVLKLAYSYFNVLTTTFAN